MGNYIEKLVCFYGADNENGFLSNFYIAPFNDGERTYNCVEQYMMYHKAKLFNDMEIMDAIMKETVPANIKRLGRAVKGYDDEKWNAVRLEIVENAVYMKFKQNRDIQDKLLEFPIDCEFAECSPTDCIWGIGLKVSSPLRFHRNCWKGKNYLGIIIGKVRDRIIRHHLR